MLFWDLNDIKQLFRYVSSYDVLEKDDCSCTFRSVLENYYSVMVNDNNKPILMKQNICLSMSFAICLSGCLDG